MRKILISLEVREATIFCKGRRLSQISDSSMKSHAWRVSLAEEIAGGVGMSSCRSSSVHELCFLSCDIHAGLARAVVPRRNSVVFHLA